MDVVTTAASGRGEGIEIPIPTEAWHETMDESVEFEVQQVALVAGHFGDNYRRC